jgi:hypothetical protein
VSIVGTEAAVLIEAVEEPQEIGSGTEIGRSHTVLVVAGCIATIALPLVVALVVLREPHWLPVRDLAETEMRVRDVTSSDPPLVGLLGRLWGYGEAGRHPGPLGFYALWPVYELFGGSSWALQVSSAALSLGGAGVAVWIGHRRGGAAGALAVTAALLVLLRAYTPQRITEPWNPHLPLVWWLVFLLALWSLLCRDRAMLPIAIFAGTFCMQNHIPYVALVVGMGAAVTALLARPTLAAWRRNEPGVRRSLLRWTGGASLLLGALWLPPVADQIVHRPGNLAILLETFRHPYDKRPSLSLAFDTWVSHLDPIRLLTGDIHMFMTPLHRLPGLLMLGVWLATVALACRQGDRTTLWLHAVVGLALVVGLVAVLRIFGLLFDYLTYWGWGTTSLLLLSIVWTLRPWLTGRTAIAVLGVCVVGLSTAFSVDAAGTEPSGGEESRTIAPLIAATVDRLRSDPAGCGDDCRYLLTWDDTTVIGNGGAGIILALEHHGIDARAHPIQVDVMRSRIINPAKADAEVHFAMGDKAIEFWDDRLDAVRIAYRAGDPEHPNAYEENRAVYLVVR